MIKWRARVSFSLQSDKDPQNNLRNRINGLLKECGVVPSGTARWETPKGGGSAEQVAQSVGAILAALSQTEALDHISIDVDCGVKEQPVPNEFKLEL